MVKEKPNSTRTYDSDGFRRRAACVCVKDDTEQEVLLVSGSKCPERWVVPGGGIEPTEDPGVAAMREVQEEAGVKGSLGRCLGLFENGDRKTRTSVFVMVVTDCLDEWEDAKSMGRRRKWFTYEEAQQQLALHKPVQKSYLELLLLTGSGLKTTTTTTITSSSPPENMTTSSDTLTSSTTPVIPAPPPSSKPPMAPPPTLPNTLPSNQSSMAPAHIT